MLKLDYMFVRRACANQLRNISEANTTQKPLSSTIIASLENSSNDICLELFQQPNRSIDLNLTLRGDWSPKKGDVNIITLVPFWWNGTCYVAEPNDTITPEELADSVFGRLAAAIGGVYIDETTKKSY